MKNSNIALSATARSNGMHYIDKFNYAENEITLEYAITRNESDELKKDVNF